jgi:integrase
LVFLSTRVLNHALQGRINAVRADEKVNVPVVMTREEIASAISLLDGTAQLMAKLLDGSGLRIMKAVQLRVKTLHQQDLVQGAWRGVPPSCTGSKTPQCRQGMGLAVSLPRPEHLRRPAFRGHPSPPRGPPRPPQGHQGGVRRAGLTKPVSAHACRHASTTHLRPRGPDTRTLRHLLGRSDLATTMLYTHILQQGGQGVLSPLDDLGV